MPTHAQPATTRTRTSAAGVAYETLKREILQGVYPPGALLTEAQLALTLQMSKTPVREALARLVHQGLLDVYPRYGYIVTAITASDVSSLFAYRSLIEGASAELAASRMGATDIERLRLVMDTSYERADPESYSRVVSLNRAFHFLLAEASGNPYLQRAVQDIFDNVDRVLWYRLNSSEAGARMWQEHEDILLAIENGDGPGAREAIQAGIARTADDVVGFLMREEVRRRVTPASTE